MDIDLKSITTTAIGLWIKLGILSMEEFNDAMKNGGYYELMNLMNSKMEKVDFDLLQSKIKECIIED